MTVRVPVTDELAEGIQGVVEHVLKAVGLSGIRRRQQSIAASRLEPGKSFE
jgi:hypothetical protein